MAECPTCGGRARALSGGRFQYLVPPPEGTYGGIAAKAYLQRAAEAGLETTEARELVVDLLELLEGVGDDLGLSEGYPR